MKKPLSESFFDPAASAETVPLAFQDKKETVSPSIRLQKLQEIRDLETLMKSVSSGKDSQKTVEWLEKEHKYETLDHLGLLVAQKKEALLREDFETTKRAYEDLHLLERIPLRFQDGDEVSVFNQKTEEKESGWKVMRTDLNRSRYVLVKKNDGDVSFRSRESVELAQDNIPVREGDQIIFPDEFLNPWTVRRVENERAACVSGIQEKIFPLEMVEKSLRENLQEGRELLQTNEDQEIELKELESRIQSLKEIIAQGEIARQAQKFTREQEQNPTTPEGVQRMRDQLGKLQQELALVIQRGNFAGAAQEQQRLKTEIIELMYWITKDRVQRMRLPARLSPGQHSSVSVRRGNGQVERHWQLASYNADTDMYTVETKQHTDGSPLKDPQTGEAQKMEKDIAREELELLQHETNNHDVMLKKDSILMMDGKPIKILYFKENGDMVVTSQIGAKDPNMTNRIPPANQGRIIDETREFLQKSLEAKKLLEELERQRTRS